MALRPHHILSLCSGVGGLELGIMLAHQYLGLPTPRTVCHVEREVAAAASLVASMEAGWFHPAPIWSDMLTFDARPWRGRIHILASGDPCQDNSVAGKRAGKSGKRFLAPEVTRIARECRPDRIFRENVPGNLGEQLDALCPPLEQMGYRIAVGIFSSAETGNTMRRERAFVLAERMGIAVGGGYGRIEANEGRRPLERITALGAGFDCFEMGEPKGLGPREGWTEHAGEQGRQTPTQPSSELGRSLRDEPQGQQRGQHHPAGRQVQSGFAALSGRTALQPAVIPGPSDTRGWIDVLDRWPELQPALSEEEAQSHLRRGIDAMAHRVERLRATGNGVDPVAAAYAYLSLDALLAETAGTGGTILMAARNRIAA